VGWDRQLERWTVAHRTPFFDHVFEALSHAGTWGAVWLVLAAVLGVALRRPPIFVWTLVAAGLAEIVSEALKAVFHRARPLAEALVTKPHSHSFPSGHSTTAFACATVLAVMVPRLLGLFFVLAAAIAWSRVYVGVHYPLDVLVGAALGVAIGLVVIRVLPRLAADRRLLRRMPRSG
jgi:undecaprenyl-diphosphatase